MLLARLTDDQHEALLTELGRPDRGLWLSPGELATRFARAVTDAGDARTQFVEALLSVAAGRAVHDDSLEDFVQGIAMSPDVEIEDAERPTLQARLLSLLSTPAIEVTAKAADIFTEHEKLFHSSRILTDIRPVFGDDPKRAPSGAVVYHLLKLDMFTAGGVEDIYVALSSEDLASLKQTVDRALDKNVALSSYLDSVGFTRFEMNDDD